MPDPHEVCGALFRGTETVTCCLRKGHLGWHENEGLSTSWWADVPSVYPLGPGRFVPITQIVEVYVEDGRFVLYGEEGHEIVLEERPEGPVYATEYYVQIRTASQWVAKVDEEFGRKLTKARAQQISDEIATAIHFFNRNVVRTGRL